MLADLLCIFGQQDLFDPEAGTEDDAEKELSAQKSEALKGEWARYCAVSSLGVQELKDVAKFWEDWYASLFICWRFPTFFLLGVVHLQRR